MRTPAHRKRLKEIVDYVFDGNVKAAAEAAGVQQPSLHRILAGKVKEPRLSTLEQLADRYGVPLDWLLGKVDDLPQEGPELGDVQTPRWWNLLMLYHERARRDDRRLIESKQASPKTDQGNRILEEYWELQRVDRTRGLFRECVKGGTTSNRAIDASYRPVLRALLEMETRLIRLARETLVKMGEL